MAEFQRFPPRRLDRQVSAHEGVDNRQVDWLLTPSQLADAQNVRISDLGKWKRRKGALAKGGRTDTPGGGLADYVTPSGDSFFTAIWGNSIYRTAGAADWQQIACGASFVSGLMHMTVPGRVNNKKSIAITTAEDAATPSQFYLYNIEDDSVTTASFANARAVTYFQNRFWVSDKEALFWSEVLDSAGFSNTNSLFMEPGVGGNVTALIAARDTTPRLWILKEEAVLLLEPRWGSSSALIPVAADAIDVVNTNLRTLSVGAGCVATRSASWVPGNESADVMFLGQDGFRSLKRVESDAQSGAGFPDSFGIQGYIDRINFAAAHKATSAVFDHAYHCAVPFDGATENSHVLRRDISGGAWSLLDWQGKDIKAFRLGDVHRMFFQNNFTTNDSSVTDAPVDDLFQVYQAFNGSIDPGTTHVNFNVTTRAFTFENPQAEKRWDSVTFQVSSAETAILQIDQRRDFGPYNTLDTLTVPAGNSSVILGEDPLIWQAGEDVIRRKQVDLSTIPPGVNLQLKFHSVTGVTEYGELAVYMVDVHAFPTPEIFEEQS